MKLSTTFNSVVMNSSHLPRERLKDKPMRCNVHIVLYVMEHSAPSPFGVTWYCCDYWKEALDLQGSIFQLLCTATIELLNE